MTAHGCSWVLLSDLEFLTSFFDNKQKMLIFEITSLLPCRQYLGQFFEQFYQNGYFQNPHGNGFRKMSNYMAKSLWLNRFKATVWSFTPETFYLDRILLIFYIQLLLTSFSKTTYPAISYLTKKSHETSIQVPF